MSDPGGLSAREASGGPHLGSETARLFLLSHRSRFVPFSQRTVASDLQFHGLHLRFTNGEVVVGGRLGLPGLRPLRASPAEQGLPPGTGLWAPAGG